ncbi:MAG: PQQ-binding-like beta-propeller repeat protein [Verrucomicrobiales bacterium]|nr:PQQ-binding-like beta-propeller repeat protein [Verrucomicrobiales bacterium]
MRIPSLLLVASATVALTGFSADWPGVHGPNGDGSSPESIPKSWPAGGPKVLWKVPSSKGFSSFVVGGGRAWTLELREVEGAPQEVLVARNADTGADLWVRTLGSVKYDGGGDSGTNDNKGGDGPRSTPTLDGDRVYVTSAKLVVSCIDAKSGDVLWQHDLMKEFSGRNITWQNAASPVVEGDLVLVAGGGAGESLIAFHKKDGKVAWKAFDETMTHATPTPATLQGQRQVIFFLKSGLLSVEPKTGKELWRFAFPFRTSTAASPVVDGDLVYCSAGYGVGAGACRVSRTGDAWKVEPVYRFEGNNPLANHWSTPVLQDGHLYGMFQFKEYGSGPVKCVDIRTGKVLWDQAGFGPGQVIRVNGGILALGDAGQLVLIEPTPSGSHELARAQVLEGKCWTTPAISKGRVYARSTKEAVCLEFGK